MKEELKDKIATEKIEAGNIHRGTLEGIQEIINMIEDKKTAYAIAGFALTHLVKTLLDGEQELPSVQEISELLGCSAFEAGYARIVVSSNTGGMMATRKAVITGRRGTGNKTNHGSGTTGKAYSVSYDIPEGGDSI